MPELPDELVEEIFLRLSPDEPAALVRASLASKPWHGVLIGPAFCSRYHEFHGVAPMLGFFYSWPDGSDDGEDPVPPFVPTTKFGPRIPDLTTVTHRRLDALGCRHGRVLLRCTSSDPTTTIVVVWNPMTGCTREAHIGGDGYQAAELYTVSGCDHRSCHVGPFKIVYVGVSRLADGECVAFSFVSSLNMGDWSKPSDDFDLELEEWEWDDEPCDDLDLAADAFIYSRPAMPVDDTLHFMLGYKDGNARVGILKMALWDLHMWMH
ncbi:hypothetical protein VPH35_120362 [Triticum aestivum]